MENKYIDHWHAEDKEWLKGRKKEWQENKKGLEGFSFIGRKDHKYLREFFLTGSVSDDYCLPKSNGKRVEGRNVPESYYIWFAPLRTVDILRDIIRDASTGGYHRDILHIFSQYAHSPSFESDFGMLGGREKLLVDVIFGRSFNEYTSFMQELYGEVPPEAHPLRFIGYFQGACSTWFTHLPDGTTYGLPRYSPIQWLVDHWVQSLHALDADDLKKAADDMSIKMLMVNLAKEIVDPPFADDRYQKTRDKILQYLESDELPAAYKEIWVKAKEGCLDPYA